MDLEMGVDKNNMSRHTPRWIIIVIALVGGLLTPSCSSMGSALRQPTPTPVPLTPLQVTPAQLAQAMQADTFFADYNLDLLSVSGKVAAVNQTGADVQISLETGLPTGVICDLGTTTNAIHSGDTVTVQAAGKDAQRGNSVVLLEKCRLHP